MITTLEECNRARNRGPREQGEARAHSSMGKWREMFCLTIYQVGTGNNSICMCHTQVMETIWLDQAGCAGRTRGRGKTAELGWVNEGLSEVWAARVGFVASGEPEETFQGKKNSVILDDNLHCRGGWILSFWSPRQQLGFLWSKMLGEPYNYITPPEAHKYSFLQF